MKKNIWFVTREYADIAEAGGVKNVVRALAEGFVSNDYAVTVFIPYYGCTDIHGMERIQEDLFLPVNIECGKSLYTVTFVQGFFKNVRFILCKNDIFLEKHSVYTYTGKDEKENPLHIKGTGFEDAMLLNCLFQKAVVAFRNVMGFDEKAPDIINCHDAVTALIPAFASINDFWFYKNTKYYVTIHNAGPGYHHNFPDLKTAIYYTGLPKGVLRKGRCNKKIEPYLIAACFGKLLTVSPKYAQELQDKEDIYSEGLSKQFRHRRISITGITNGIDFERYNPTDLKISELPYVFNPEKKDLEGKLQCRRYFISKYNKAVANANSLIRGIDQYGFIESTDSEKPVYINFHGRVVQQKGTNVFSQAVKLLIRKYKNVRFLIMGQGQAEYENSLILLTKLYPGKCIFFRGYDRALSRLCTAVCDFICIPSFFEPCGLEDLIAQIYGTIPVAHATGGLTKIIDKKTGFLYKNNTPENIASVFSFLIDKKTQNPLCFNNIIAAAALSARTVFSWDFIIKNQYKIFFEEFYKKR